MSFQIPVPVPMPATQRGPSFPWQPQAHFAYGPEPELTPPSLHAAPEHQLPELDAETVAAAQMGNPQASTHILRTYYDCVFQLLWQMTHLELGDNRTEALCQETFSRFFLALRAEPQPLVRPIRPWLLELARVVAMNHLHQLQFPPAVASRSQARGQAASPNHVHHHADSGSWSATDDAMQKISPAHREILFLRQEQGLSYIEISRLLGVCVGTVKSRLSRSRKALKIAMQKQG